ncbi:MAG: hypothetical protein V1690_03085 [Candidatus Moraniibacteriota bacterium]
MSVFEEWDKDKKERFENYGFKVHELKCDRIMSGEKVRCAMKEKISLARMVPLGTLKVMMKDEFFDENERGG